MIPKWALFYMILRWKINFRRRLRGSEPSGKVVKQIKRCAEKFVDFLAYFCIRHCDTRYILPSLKKTYFVIMYQAKIEIRFSTFLVRYFFLIKLELDSGLVWQQNFLDAPRQIRMLRFTVCTIITVSIHRFCIPKNKRFVTELSVIGTKHFYFAQSKKIDLLT